MSTVADKICPLQDRVVIKRLDEEKVTSGGIVIPDSAKEKPIRGIVVAAGPGKLLENGDRRALDIKINDKVLFGKYAGTEIKFGDDDLVVMREDDVIAVVKG